VVWGRTFKRTFGTDSRSAPREDDIDDQSEVDPFEHRDDGDAAVESPAGWEEGQDGEGQSSEVEGQLTT